jgi:hypothetical protein
VRGKTFLQELVDAAESAIAAFDRAFLRMFSITPLDEEADDNKAASDKPAKE